MFPWIGGFSRTARSRRRGSVAIHVGILMVILIAMAGLGTEIPFLMYKHRQMQTAANSAALGAAVALMQGYPSPISTEAYGIAAALGFTNGAGNVTVAVNNPPTSGSYTTNLSAVEVIVTQPHTLKLAGVLGVSLYNLSARAVALAGSGSGGYCMLELDPVGMSRWGGPTTGVGLWGGVVVTMTGCGMAVNAAGSQALTLQSGGTLNAPLVSIVGQLNNVWSTVNVTSLKTGQSAISDPYANVSMPSSAGCDHDGFWANPSQLTLSPGTYCNGMSFGGGYAWTLQPGVYYIKSGQFNVAGGASVTGTGVIIVLTTNDGSSYATFSITNGIDLTLSAPTTDQYGTGTAGILFFGDRNAPPSNTNVLSGFTTANLQGAIYLPTQTMQYGSSAGTITGCQQLIAWHVDDNINNLPFDGTCTDTGMKPIGASTLLVE